MDVLNTFALPQSAEHFHLLLLVHNLVMLFFLPYVALLVGSLLMAVIMDRRAEKAGDSGAGRLARRLASIALPDRSTFVFLAVLPSLVVVFLYVQMFQETKAIAPGIAALGSLFLIAGGVAGFAFRFTFTVDDIISLAGKGSGAAEDARQPVMVSGFLDSTRRAHRRSGNWAVVLLLTGAFLFAGASTIGLNPALWQAADGLFALLLTGGTWIEMLAFLAAAAGMTGAGLLFHRYVWHAAGATHDPDDPVICTTAVRLTTAGILAMPVVLLAGTALIPATSLAGWVYALLALSIGSLALGLLFLYAFVQSGRSLYVALLMLTIVAALGFNVTKNRIAVHIGTADHAAQLAGAYDKQTEEFRTSLGVMAKQMTGEEIFNAKCSACHMYDQKKVGPPYQTVIPKYAGKKSALVAFVLNPVKIDPAYPNMPSQGLKPSEADSVATFLLGKLTDGKQ